MRSLSYFWKEIKYKVNGVRIGIRNLIKWTPIIWKDRDWDKHYILEVLLFKMKNQRDYMKSQGYQENSSRILPLEECIDLLEKVHNEWENYEEPAYKKHEEQWGKSEFYFIPSKEKPNSYEMKDRNEERYTEQEIKKKRESFLLYSNIARLKRNRDFEFAMSLFVKHFDEWWD